MKEGEDRSPSVGLLLLTRTPPRASYRSKVIVSSRKRVVLKLASDRGRRSIAERLRLELVVDPLGFRVSVAEICERSARVTRVDRIHNRTVIVSAALRQEEQVGAAIRKRIDGDDLAAHCADLFKALVPELTANASDRCVEIVILT